MNESQTEAQAEFSDSAVLSVPRDREAIRRLEAAIRLLEPALRATEIAGLETASLQSVLSDLVERHRAADGGPPAPGVRRGRPSVQRHWAPDDPRPRYGLYVDESGGRRLTIGKDGAYFAVGGVLIADWEYPALEAAWLEWKRRSEAHV